MHTGTSRELLTAPDEIIQGGMSLISTDVTLSRDTPLLLYPLSYQSDRH